MKTRKLIYFFLFFIFPGIVVLASGNEMQEKEGNNEKFNASEFIMGHIADAHEWHIYTKKNGEHVALYLPVIVYNKENGLNIFSSKKFAHGHDYKGFRLEEEGDLKGKIVSLNEDGHVDMENLPLDLSITKTIFGMLFSAIIGLILFLTLARSYKKAGISHPKGIRSFMEPIICFVRDEIAIPNLGLHKFEKFMPYLLTVFFFILINNIMGLLPFPPPFGANVMGNIAVTFTLAAFTFLVTQINGSKSYWKHTFAAPGVPFWLLPIMIPVELIGILAKPFALMIRLFANILAGHIIVLSLVCLIFIFKSLAVAPVSILFVIFMDCLELFVAFLQAYVFTLLSALFIGLATTTHH